MVFCQEIPGSRPEFGLSPSLALLRVLRLWTVKTREERAYTMHPCSQKYFLPRQLILKCTVLLVVPHTHSPTGRQYNSTGERSGAALTIRNFDTIPSKLLSIHLIRYHIPNRLLSAPAVSRWKLSQ